MPIRCKSRFLALSGGGDPIALRSFLPCVLRPTPPSVRSGREWACGANRALRDLNLNAHPRLRLDSSFGWVAIDRECPGGAERDQQGQPPVGRSTFKRPPERQSAAVASQYPSRQKAHWPCLSVHQSMDLRIAPSSSVSDRLFFGTAWASGPMLMDLDASGVDRPETPGPSGRKPLQNRSPHPRLAPLLPSCVDRGEGCEDAKGAPTTALPKTIEQCMKNSLIVQSWASRRSFSTLRAGSYFVNFLSRGTRSTSDWLRQISSSFID